MRERERGFRPTEDQKQAILTFLRERLEKFVTGVDTSQKMIQAFPSEAHINQLRHFQASVSCVKKLIADVQQMRLAQTEGISSAGK